MTRLLPLLALSIACGTPDTDDDTDTPGPVLEAGDHAWTEEIGGIERTWAVHVPPAAADGQPLPLVFNLHPFVLGGNEVFHNIWQAESGTETLADVEGFLVVHPEGTGAPAAWNAGEVCCGDASEQDVDDVGFILALIDRVSALTPVDDRRIYSTGMSNGGYLSHRLACEHPDRFAAIAPVVGSLSSELVCADGRAVPVLQVSGSEDSVDQMEASAARWAEANGCDAASADTPSPGADASCHTWSGCDDGAEVTHCVIADGGHCWFSSREGQASPGCGPVQFETEVAAWDFFQRWTLP